MKKSILLAALFAGNVHASPGPQVEKAIGEGAKLFSHESFGGKRTCDACHLNGGKGAGKLPNGQEIPSLENAGAIFPRFNQRAKRIITLEDQVRSCIHGGLQGNPPPAGDEKVIDLLSYVTSLSEGKPVEMDGKPR